MRVIKVFALAVFLAGRGNCDGQTLEIRTNRVLTGWVFLLPDTTSSTFSELGLDGKVLLDSNGVGFHTIKEADKLKIRLYEKGEDLSEHVRLQNVIVSGKHREKDMRYFAFYIPSEMEREYPEAYWNRISVRDKLYRKRMQKEEQLRKLRYKL